MENKELTKKNSWLEPSNIGPITDKEDLAIDVGSNVLSARIFSGLTQKELAGKMSTLQPSIARVERGSKLPSLGYLLRVADALNTSIVAPTFGSIKEEIILNQSYISLIKIENNISLSNNQTEPRKISLKIESMFLAQTGNKNFLIKDYSYVSKEVITR